MLVGLPVSAGMLVAAIALAACGGGSSAGTTATTAAPTDPLPTATTATTLTTVERLRVEAAGATWEVPAGICSGDPGERAAAVDFLAAEVERMIAGRVSGWPTTTIPPPGEDRFAAEVLPAGAAALAAAEVAGLGPALAERWAEFEAGYADPAQGWGGITEIAALSPGWRDPAAALAAAIPAACAAR